MPSSALGQRRERADFVDTAERPAAGEREADLGGRAPAAPGVARMPSRHRPRRRRRGSACSALRCRAWRGLPLARRRRAYWTLAVSSSTRFDRASMSLLVGTPSLLSARATRSSNTCSSLSQVPFALASPLRSCASHDSRQVAELRLGELARRAPRGALPSFTSASNTFAALFLRLGERAQSRQPDLLRRIAHRAASSHRRTRSPALAVAGQLPSVS